MFENIDVSSAILQTYQDSWFLWVGFFILGFLLLKYGKHLSTSKRETRNKEDSGAGLMALSIVIHLVVIYALL